MNGEPPAPETRAGLPVLAFPGVAALEAWLAAQPGDAPGLWLKLARKAAGQAAGLTRGEAIDAALCHGWIDGQADRCDDAFWLLRMTPRRPRSRWSDVNRARVRALEAAGRMRPAGSAQVEAAKADGRWDAAYPPPSRATVPDDLRLALAANPAAAATFGALSGASRYAVLHRVAAVKRAETRARKIAGFVERLARGETTRR